MKSFWIESFGNHCTSHTWNFLIFPRFGKFSAIIPLNNFSFPFYLLNLLLRLTLVNYISGQDVCWHVHSTMSQVRVNCFGMHGGGGGVCVYVCLAIVVWHRGA
jgi:hypothetical protein